MKKIPSKTSRERQKKQEELPDRLERISRHMASTKVPFDSENASGRAASVPLYRKIIE